MKVKTIVTEDFSNYKKIAMFISAVSCNWKCCAESGYESDLCQNEPLAQMETKELDNEKIVDKYLNDPITNSVVIGGLEPFDQFDDMMEFIEAFRKRCDDDIVIYTGYNENEIISKIEILKSVGNIIVKFGRYIPNDKPKYDEVLGVTLASSNQYAKVLSEV